MPDLPIYQVDDEGTVSLALDVGGRVMTGMDALFQRVVLKFLKTPGSDILRLNDGGGLQAMLFSGAGATAEPQVMADIAEIVRRVRVAVSEDQQGLNLPASERLRDLVVDSIDPDVSTSSLVLTVSLASEAGEVAARTIGL